MGARRVGARGAGKWGRGNGATACEEMGGAAGGVGVVGALEQRRAAHSAVACRRTAVVAS